jgi:hypothetical protein
VSRGFLVVLEAPCAACAAGGAFVVSFCLLGGFACGVGDGGPGGAAGFEAGDEAGEFEVVGVLAVGLGVGLGVGVVHAAYFRAGGHALARPYYMYYTGGYGESACVPLPAAEPCGELPVQPVRAVPVPASG